MAFDMESAFRSDLPAAAGAWQDPPDFSFVGGHNDAESVPFGGLAEAATTVLRRHGSKLATYNLGGSPQGWLPLREFISTKLETRASMPTDPDEILVVSGSLQALDLVNDALLSPGDTVIVEQATYGGALSRLKRMGVSYVGVELDDEGIDTDHLATLLADLAADGVTPKYLYTIPTVQNPTGSVLPLERRLEILRLAREYGVVIFEDDCYSDLTWGCERPPTIRALDQRDGGGQVIYCGSFSKSIAPALRIGYVVADQPAVRQLLALKTDAGTGALEQLVLAEYLPTHFDEHVDQLMSTLRGKCEVMREALAAEFGDLVSVTEPMGGIYVWLTFPEGVNTSSFVAAAADVGIQFNPGAEWSTGGDYGSRRLRLCFGHPDHDTIRAGVTALAEIVRQHTDLAF